MVALSTATSSSSTQRSKVGGCLSSPPHLSSAVACSSRSGPCQSPFSPSLSTISVRLFLANPPITWNLYPKSYWYYLGSSSLRIFYITISIHVSAIVSSLEYVLNSIGIGGNHRGIHMHTHIHSHPSSLSSTILHLLSLSYINRVIMIAGYDII